jgi:hypothetical protein
MTLILIPRTDPIHTHIVTVPIGIQRSRRLFTAFKPSESRPSFIFPLTRLKTFVFSFVEQFVASGMSGCTRYRVVLVERRCRDLIRVIRKNQITIFIHFKKLRRVQSGGFD